MSYCSPMGNLPRLRIAHFIETEVPGGAESLMLSLIEWLRRQGIDVVLFHFGYSWAEKAAVELDFKAVVVRNAKWFKSVRTLPLFAASFAQQLRSHRIDVLHSHLFGPTTGGALACLLAGVSHIGTLHDTHVVEEDPRRRCLLRLATRLGTELVAVSTGMREAYVKTWGLNPRRIMAIPNGVRLNGRERLPIRAEARRQLGVSDDEVLLISVGRLAPIKRVPEIIKAVGGLLPRTGSTLLVVGDGPDFRACEEAARGTEHGRVIFLGQRTDVRDLLLASDLFLQYSQSEGLSLAVLEALDSGLPCVLTAVGANGSLVNNARTGYLVDPDGHLREFTQAVERCLRLIRRKDVEDECRKVVAENFAEDRCFSAYLRLYGFGGQPAVGPECAK